MLKRNKINNKLIIPKKIGTCLLMCPENERLLREKEGLLHIFEKSKDNPRKADPMKIIKSFNRSAAGQNLNKSSDLRPPKILHETVKYLVKNILTKTDIDWAIIYDFTFDRTRAIRQDMIIQNLDSSESIDILEIIVKFHIYSAYRLCEENHSRFDPAINMKHLLECVKRLLVLYEEQNNNSNENAIKARSETEALYILLTLGNIHSLNRAFTLPQNIKSDIFKKAVDISLSFYLGNYFRVCKKIKELPILLLMSSVLHLPLIRRTAFSIMSTAYNSKNLTFPLVHFEKMLLYNNKCDAINDCEHYKIETRGDFIHFKKCNMDINAKMLPPTHCIFVDQILENISITQLLLNHQE